MTEREILRLTFDAAPFDGEFWIDTNGEMLRLNIQYDDAVQSVVLDATEAWRVGDAITSWTENVRQERRQRTKAW
jgi:hypothetical protein